MKRRDFLKAGGVGLAASAVAAPAIAQSIKVEEIVETPWPESDRRLIVDDNVTIAVQVNGKLRATIALPRDASQAVAESAALSEDAVQRVLAGKAPRKVIVVPNRIVNVVV